MNPSTSHRISAQVREDACEWFIRLHDDGFEGENRRAFAKWLLQSPEHGHAYLRIASLWGDSRVVRRFFHADPSAPLDVAEPMTSGSAYGLRREVEEKEGSNPVKNKRTFSFKSAAIAATLSFGVALAFVAQDYMESAQVVTTEASQWHHMTLADGTVVHVDARSRVEVKYTDKARIVHVYEGGAVFDVVKDPPRPFIARTHLVDVTAMGTRFGVSIDPGVTTTVSEGTVRVTGRGRVDGNAVLVNAGEELRVSDSSLSSPHFAHVDAERKLQWANGRLILRRMTVLEGVEQFNRRNRIQIVVESPTLGARVVDFASIEVDSPESYARIVAAQEGVRMIFDKENNVIRLSE